MRARYFLSDSSRNTRVEVRIGDRVVPLPSSDPAGYFIGEITLTNSEATQLAKDSVITFESLPTATNSERFRGTAVLVPEEGVTVITDMDDTIKITNVLDPKEKVANTFAPETLIERRQPASPERAASTCPRHSQQNRAIASSRTQSRVPVTGDAVYVLY